jgi:hypothetical protein
MIEAGAPSTGESRHVCACARGVVPAPPGGVMVAPPQISRKTQPGKVKAAPSTMGRKRRGQGEHYRGRSPTGPRPDDSYQPSPEPSQYPAFDNTH